MGLGWYFRHLWVGKETWKTATHLPNCSSEGYRICSLIQSKGWCVRVCVGGLDGDAVWIEHTAAVFPNFSPRPQLFSGPPDGHLFEIMRSKNPSDHIYPGNHAHGLRSPFAWFLLQQTYFERARSAFYQTSWLSLVKITRVKLTNLK